MVTLIDISLIDTRQQH